jgi:ABC-type multidrug transport system fused ATPase/permease subunit
MLALVTLGKIAVGFCDLSVAAAMYLLFLLLQGHPAAHHLWWTPRTALSAAVITTLLVVLRGLMDLLSSRAVFRQIENLYSDFLLRLTDGYSKLQWEQFVERNRSELSGHALHTAREAADFYYLCIEMTANVVIVSVMTAALVYQSLIAACSLGLVLALFYGGHRLLIRKRLQKAASIRETALRTLQRNLADLFSSGKEIRTYGNQAFFQERIRRQAERAAVSKLRTLFLPHFARIAADQGAVLVFLAFVITVEMRQGDVRQVLSLLVFYFVLSRRLLPLISQISFVAGQMEGSYENVKVVDSELDRCRRYRTLALPAQMPDAGMVMQMMQVSFSFHGGPPILRNVNLAIREGETVVLHGASGIGKSSLLNLVAGVSKPVTGVVHVDRTTIAYVPQEISLLDDSIRNNLLFGLPQRSDEELMKALAVAKLDELVTALPLRLETGVGDNGVLFSGGERQRLGLARAILRGSLLLLLDEATSALDEENERQVLENLNASGMAILLVTHRAHARSFAHRVLRLEEGSLIEETSHALLV